MKCIKLALFVFFVGANVSAKSSDNNHSCPRGSADIFQTGVFSIRLPPGFAGSAEPQGDDWYFWHVDGLRSRVSFDYGFLRKGGAVHENINAKSIHWVAGSKQTGKNRRYRYRWEAIVVNAEMKEPFSLTITAESQDATFLEVAKQIGSTFSWVESTKYVRLLSADNDKQFACLGYSSGGCRCGSVGATVTRNFGILRTIGDRFVEIEEWFYSPSSGDFSSETMKLFANE